MIRIMHFVFTLLHFDSLIPLGQAYIYFLLLSSAEYTADCSLSAKDEISLNRRHLIMGLTRIQWGP